MTRSVLLTAIAILIVSVNASDNAAIAQNRGGVYPGAADPYNRRPTVSPYLNLLQPGGAFNLPQYQSFVRPLLDQQAANERNAFDNQLLRRQVGSLQNQVNNLGSVGPGRATGHPTRFMNYSHFFLLR